MKYNVFIILITIFTSTTIFYAKKAFVAVPVTDLVGSPVKSDSSVSKFKIYETFPLESQKGTFYCKRIHQLIFNEVVDVIDETNYEIKIKIPNCFYVDSQGIKQTTYWARKSDFITFDQLIKHNLQTSHIPKPIHYNNNISHKETHSFRKKIKSVYKNLKNWISRSKQHTPQPTDQNYVTLTFPFYDKKTKQTFSTGTRFVKASKQNNQKYTQVYIFDKRNNTFTTTLMPQEKLYNNTQKSNAEKKAAFVRLLKKWANHYNGFIPYVWGGCSFTHLCKKNTIKTVLLNKKKNNKRVQVYTRPDFPHKPIPGFDCSGLVLRAAQICNIPYFCKNTTTIKKSLSQVNSYKNLKNGDLIVYSGHVIIISDKKHNKILEARTNEFGTGKVHEIALSKAFHNIQSYQDLFALKKEKKTLDRIDNKGKIRQKIKDFSIVSLIQK